MRLVVYKDNESLLKIQDVLSNLNKEPDSLGFLGNYPYLCHPTRN